MTRDDAIKKIRILANAHGIDLAAIADADLITVAEAAELRGVTESAVRRWITHYGLPATRRAATQRAGLMLRREDVEAFTPGPKGQPRKRQPAS